jgi:hypothetical protein
MDGGSLMNDVGMRVRTKPNALLWVALALLTASVAQAQVRTVTDYQSPVREGTKTTYLDLLRKLFPDVEMGAGGGADAKAQTSIPLNHLSGEYRGKVYRGEMQISGIYSPGDQRKNRGQLLLLVEAHNDDGGELFTWGDISVLALFQLEPTVKLLDAVDTQADRFTSFWEEQPLLRLNSRDDTVIIENTHHNSSQGYQWLTIVSVENNRLRTIFDLPLLNEKACGNSFTQTPSINVLKGSKGARPNLSVQVKMVKERDEEGCEKRTEGYTRYYRAVLVWNSSKRVYESRGNALARLARFNKGNY